MIALRTLLAILALAVASSGCERGGPRALITGEDACATCRMTIDDARFGALLITAKGKLETFDSIECLASFVATLPPALEPRGVYVADFDHPSHWLDARRAQFLHQGQLRSPMGRELAAFPADSTAESLIGRFGGHTIGWADVLALMRTKLGVEPRPPTRDTIWVSRTPRPAPARVVTRVTEALAIAPRHALIRVASGVYAEPALAIRHPLTLQGEPGAILDGGGAHEILGVGADSVTVRGFTFRNTGSSQATDRAALRVVEAAGCLIEDNRFENTLFGIYLQKASACLVRRNRLTGMAGSQTVTGNGLHAWSSRNIVFEDNVVEGHRDGIYFEFTIGGVARRNVSASSRRYGLHFMFSDSCVYEGNTFRDNQSGVAVMYAKHVRISDNRFERSRGSASYGLLLKEISDSDIRHNTFAENSVGLHMEGANRNDVADNDFVRNGWAVRVLADAQDNTLHGNIFVGNVFDVGTNSRSNYSTFRGNWWDRYRGFDLDHNGIGDVAHAPVRLFSLLVQQAPAALVLVRSLLVDVLDVAERVVPTLTPETLRDAAPLMHAPRRLP